MNDCEYLVIYGIFIATVHPQGSENSVEVEGKRISELKGREVCCEVCLQAVILMS